MPEQLLTILKVCLLALLYLFFARVLRAVWVEVNGPRGKRARRRLATEQEATRARAVARAAPGLGGPLAPPPASHSQVGPHPASSQPAQGRRASRRKPTPDAPTSPRPPGLVTVAPPELAGRRWDLGSELTLGRATDCSITLDDTYASQVHCRVFVSDGGVYVEDLGSTNGTYLNRGKVTGTMLVSSGDQVQIGSTVLELN